MAAFFYQINPGIAVGTEQIGIVKFEAEAIFVRRILIAIDIGPHRLDDGLHRLADAPDLTDEGIAPFDRCRGHHTPIEIILVGRAGRIGRIGKNVADIVKIAPHAAVEADHLTI